jgi:hypothetical protein
MNDAGRPLRFLIGVAGGWTLLRVATLWSDGAPPPTIVPASIASVPPKAPVLRTMERRMVVAMATAEAGRPVRAPKATPAPRLSFAALPREPSLPLFAVSVPGSSAAVVPAPRHAEDVPIQLPIGITRRAGWSASTWLLLRDGGPPGVAPGSQLGGGQAGVRVDRAIGSGLALTGRLTSPLQGRGREAAVGIAWLPAGVPIRVVAEQRIAVDGGGGGPSLLVAGGVSDVIVMGSVRGEGYAQGGAIARGGGEMFVDGAARLFHPIGEAGGMALDVGVGAWGAKQRGAGRVDLGPSVAVRLPLAGGGTRLQLDWRRRVAGDARPGSGPALTLGADF